jgi:hypothetical protein
MDKSEESNRPLGRLIEMEGEHPVIPFGIDLPMNVVYRQETEELVVECPNLQIGNLEQAAILRIRFSPEAARSLQRRLRELEKFLGREIGAEPKLTSQQ